MPSPPHNPSLEGGALPSRALDKSPSRRRPRVDSDTSRTSPRPDPKRFRFGPTDYLVPNQAMATTVPAMSTKRRGKLPETIDLTQQNAFRPGAGAKKLVIKNLRPASSSPGSHAEQYYERARSELREALAAIFNKQPIRSPLERLYRAVEDICRRGQAQELYRMLQELCETHLRTGVLRSIHVNGGTENVDMVRSVLSHWEVWNKQIITIRSIFSYLDRTYLLKEKPLVSINDMAITQYRRMTLIPSKSANEPSPWSKTLEGTCDLVAYERSRDSRFDSTLLKDSIRMLYVFGQYQKAFEPAFIEDSAKYFAHFAKERSSLNLRDYVLACEKLLREEQYRCDVYNFDSSTKKQLLDAAYDILVKDYSGKLLNSDSLSELLSEQDATSVKALYELLRSSGIQTQLRKPWGEYMQAKGASIVGDTARGDDMVMRLLEHRRSLDLMVRDAFNGDDGFSYDLRQAFGAFMNDTKMAAGWSAGTSKIGEMIAKHIDLLLRGGLKALPKVLLSDNKDRTAAEQQGLSGTGDEEAELDRQLDQALELFRFIEGKDAFEAFYKKDLARRLLMGRSASSDAERNMIRKLQQECGNNFTRNLEQMFKDQELAKGEMEAYKEWVGGSARGPGTVDLQVMVISAAAWPSYTEVALNIPADVAEEVKRFEGWFNTKHDGRKLTWPHGLAHCTVKATFPKGTKELLVSAFQAVVLVLFNSVGLEGFLSYEQISTTTGLQGGDLARTLQSLACGKIRVLTKHPKGRDVNPTDTFTINKAFSDPKFRIKINQIQLKETKEENKEMHERIEQDRRFETQAAIVRIMKTRKTIGHAELVAETINLTRKRGPVDAAQIKKEIESLIDKDYIEREGKLYSYVA